MRVSSNCRCAMLGLSALLLAAAPLPERPLDGERVLRFHSDIGVNPDASLTVQETITVQTTGEQIKHGIYRDFPTQYRTKWFAPVTVGFEIVDLQRDGASESYHTEERPNGIRVYFGRGDTLLDPGEHTYAFTYKTDRQIGFFDDKDELNWNVTGNGWIFPIDETSATVRLPTSVPAAGLTLNGFTGPQDSGEQAYESEVEDSGEIAFRATRPLEPAEGLTIVVAFPKGIVTAPSAGYEFRAFVSNLPAQALRFKGVLVVVAYFLIVWALVGRDPMKGQIVIQTSPPPGISPAAARYVVRMGFDKMTFSTALVSLASKGFVTIEEKDGAYHIEQVQPSTKDLPPEERALMRKLLPSGKGITLKQTSHRHISQALTACEKALKLDYEKTYFLTNSKYWIPGLALSIVVIVWTLLTTPTDSETPVIFLSIWLSFWTIGVVALASQVFMLWRKVINGSAGIAGIGEALFMTLFATPFFAAEIVVGGILVYNASWHIVVLAIVLAVTDVLFYRLLKAPTLLGRTTMDHLDGFRQYLAGERRDRYGAGVIEEVTPAMFEEHLAYAMALDVESAWANRLAETVGRSGQSPDHGQPAWYRGDLWRDRGAGGFASAIGSSVTSAIAASSTAPGSSSRSSGGSSGGGSSGGGGGGGGGGGW